MSIPRIFAPAVTLTGMNHVLKSLSRRDYFSGLLKAKISCQKSSKESSLQTVSNTPMIPKTAPHDARHPNSTKARGLRQTCSSVGRNSSHGTTASIETSGSFLASTPSVSVVVRKIEETHLCHRHTPMQVHRVNDTAMPEPEQFLRHPTVPDQPAKTNRRKSNLKSKNH